MKELDDVHVLLDNEAELLHSKVVAHSWRDLESQKASWQNVEQEGTLSGNAVR